MTSKANTIKTKKDSGGQKKAIRIKPGRFVKGTHDMLDGSFIRKGNLAAKVYFVLFLVALGLIYIANNHFAEKKIREIDRLQAVNKELSFDYLSMKTKLNEKKRASYLAGQLKKYGIEPSVEPPEKISVNP